MLNVAIMKYGRDESLSGTHREIIDGMTVCHDATPLWGAVAKSSPTIHATPTILTDHSHV
jgi:hypothetical protein